MVSLAGEWSHNKLGGKRVVVGPVADKPGYWYVEGASEPFTAGYILANWHRVNYDSMSESESYAADLLAEWAMLQSGKGRDAIMPPMPFGDSHQQLWDAWKQACIDTAAEVSRSV